MVSLAQDISVNCTSLSIHLDKRLLRLSIIFILSLSIIFKYHFKYHFLQEALLDFSLTTG